MDFADYQKKTTVNEFTMKRKKTRTLKKSAIKNLFIPIHTILNVVNTGQTVLLSTRSKQMGVSNKMPKEKAIYTATCVLCGEIEVVDQDFEIDFVWEEP
jgi:hypothetical protein